MRRYRFSYVLTLAYVVSVFLVWLIVQRMPPNAQIAATLFAIASLLIVTGATLIAVYTLTSDLRRRHDHLLKLLAHVQAALAEANARAPLPGPEPSPSKEPPSDPSSA